MEMLLVGVRSFLSAEDKEKRDDQKIV